jgi:hypothetical protein
MSHPLRKSAGASAARRERGRQARLMFSRLDYTGALNEEGRMRNEELEKVELRLD